MQNSKKKPSKTKMYTVISLLLSLIVIILIFYFTIDSTTWEHLSTAQLRYEYFVFAVFLHILTWFIWGARLKILSTAIDGTINIGVLKATNIIITNLFFASITPSVAGGEPVRIFLLKKEGMSLGSATASVLCERLIDALFVLVCIPFALYVLQDYITIGFIRIGVIIGILVFILCVLLFLYAIKNPEKTKSFVIFIDKKVISVFRKKNKTEQTTLIKTINREVDNFHNSMVFFIGKGRQAFCMGAFLTALFWLTGFLIPSMLLLGLGLPPHFIQSYSAQIILLIIVMMPTTPGSSGIAEGGMAGLYNLFIGSSLLGVFVLLFRFITYHINLIAGSIFQYKIFKSLTSYSLDKIKK